MENNFHKRNHLFTIGFRVLEAVSPQIKTTLLMFIYAFFSRDFLLGFIEIHFIFNCSWNARFWGFLQFNLQAVMQGEIRSWLQKCSVQNVDGSLRQTDELFRWRKRAQWSRKFHYLIILTVESRYWLTVFFQGFLFILDCIRPYGFPWCHWDSMIHPRWNIKFITFCNKFQL